MRFVNVAIAYVFNARIRHLSRRYGIAAADSAWINHAREANKFGTLINGNLFFTHHMQVAVDQYLVNRHRQRAAKGIAGIGPALSVERVTTGGFDIGTSVTKQPLQIARHSIKAKISFTVTAGIRRGAFAGADVLLQHDGQRIANIAWSTIDLQPTDWCSFMEKDYLRISSTVLVSLLFGLALVLVNSWFNQPGVEEVVPRSTYLMVMIALFFIDTVAFIFMQLYFIYDRRQFSNCVLSLAFLSCLIYFVKTVIIIQQIIEERLTSSVVQNDIAIYYLFRQMSLCILIFLALVNKVSENTKQRNLFSKKMTLCISLFFVFGGPIVAHILSSHYESYNLHIAELTNENGQVVWKASYVTIMIFMWLTLLSVNLYFNGLRYDIWNGVTVIAFCAVLYNISLLFMSRYSVSTWYISRTIEVVSKLTVMVIFMCHIFSALRVTKNIAHRDRSLNQYI